MTISFIPASGPEIASSRIRVYLLQEALRGLGLESHIGLRAEASTVVIQKRVTRDVILAARSLKAAGKTVFYDCDDLGPALQYWAPDPLFREMLAIADVITTNSSGFREAFVREYGAEKVELLPDAVDYGLKQPMPATEVPGSKLRVLWFGNSTNLHLLEQHWGALSRIPGCELVVCTDSRRPVRIFDDSVKTVPWDVATFPAVLRSVHVSFLPHDGAPHDRVKSSNRMITTIAWGVPAVVSATPEYVHTAELIGRPDTVFSSSDEIGPILEQLSMSIQRSEYLRVVQPVIWARHSPLAVATRFVSILQQYTR